MGHRQLAALVLKRLVKERWDSASKHFTPPELGADEKTAIKRDLVPGLADAQIKVRIAIGMVVAGKRSALSMQEDFSNPHEVVEGQYHSLS